MKKYFYDIIKNGKPFETNIPCRRVTESIGISAYNISHYADKNRLYKKVYLIKINHIEETENKPNKNYREPKDPETYTTINEDGKTATVYVEQEIRWDKARLALNPKAKPSKRMLEERKNNLLKRR
jgi:hypothetical protein